MGKSCGQLDFFSLGGQYYSLGQSTVHVITKNDSQVAKNG